MVVAGRECEGLRARECRDPSRPAALLCRHAVATDHEIDEAVACAAADPDGWRTLSVDARSDVLGRVAQELRRARGRLLRVAMLDGGKLLTEADPEVSEAIDFVEFYRATARSFFELPGVEVRSCGVVVVVPPWNFPIAIPCGGIAAALAAGNTVILKPASDTVLMAWELCQCFWRAGVSRRVLQFVPCSGAGPGASLVAHRDVSAVILTGGTDTALEMLAAKPDLRLSAETGGKNATIVTAMSDRELAIKHVVHSAFGHGGQKCSATSLLLLEAEVYDDPAFKRMLCDAVRACTSARPTTCTPAWARSSGRRRAARRGPQNARAGRDLGRDAAAASATTRNLWSPGVKWGVSPGSSTHLTEFFGPLLGVMRFERLDEAIELVNATGYGLTSGIHSLDDREIERWKRGIRAGNLYVNRGTTGAIVLRQPFGGMGKSCGGAGAQGGRAELRRRVHGVSRRRGLPAVGGTADRERRPCGRVRAAARRRRGPPAPHGARELRRRIARRVFPGARPRPAPGAGQLPPLPPVPGGLRADHARRHLVRHRGPDRSGPRDGGAGARLVRAGLPRALARQARRMDRRLGGRHRAARATGHGRRRRSWTPARRANPLRRPQTACPPRCGGRRRQRASGSPTCRWWPRAGSSCSGICASRASRTTTTATATSAAVPANPAASEFRRRETAPPPRETLPAPPHAPSAPRRGWPARWRRETAARSRACARAAGSRIARRR